MQNINNGAINLSLFREGNTVQKKRLSGNFQEKERNRNRDKGKDTPKIASIPSL